MNKHVNGVLIALTPEEIAQRATDVATAIAEQKARAWLDGRISEYPSLSDQMDTIYHKGIDVWKADIAAIKTKHPKPQG